MSTVVSDTTMAVLSNSAQFKGIGYLLEDTRVCVSTIGERVMANLDHVCLFNQSHYSLDVIEHSELCDSHCGDHINE